MFCSAPNDRNFRHEVAVRQCNTITKAALAVVDCVLFWYVKNGRWPCLRLQPKVEIFREIRLLQDRFDCMNTVNSEISI
jgi:hypothetical protein